MTIRHLAKPVAILAVDPGESCGVAYFYNGELKNRELVDGYDANRLDQIVCDFLASCFLHNHVGVLVMEKPPTVLYGTKGGGTRSLAGVGSVIGCRKLWQRAWANNGGVKRRVVNVHPSTWRARIGIRGRGLKSEFLKTLAINRVRAEFKVEPASSDEAEAILIGKWAVHAEEVRAVLPRSRVA